MLDAKRMEEQIRQEVFKRDNYTCRYCGNKTGPFHADHVYPYSKGGETSARNLVTACASCNTRKGSKVGLYPMPIGYFEPKPHKINYYFMTAVSDFVLAFFALMNRDNLFAWMALGAAILFSAFSILYDRYGDGLEGSDEENETE